MNTFDKSDIARMVRKFPQSKRFEVRKVKEDGDHLLITLSRQSEETSLVISKSIFDKEIRSGMQALYGRGIGVSMDLAFAVFDMFGESITPYMSKMDDGWRKGPTIEALLSL